MGDLLLPVGERRMSSWAQHQRRSPRSSEPGTDFYCPIGTPILAPADGVIYGTGSFIGPATGRWVGVEFDNGMCFRALHLSRIVRFSGRVRRGEVLGYSGASGYGEEDWSWNPVTGGAHVHVTLWPTHMRRFGYDAAGRPFTVDFMAHVGGEPAGGEAAPFDPEEDELNDTQAAQLAQAASDAAAAKHALFYGGNWQNSDGSNQVAKYGVLPIVIHNQGLIARQAGRLAAIEQVVEQLAVGAGAVLDMDAIAAAAERGAEKALEGLTLRAV